MWPFERVRAFAVGQHDLVELRVRRAEPAETSRQCALCVGR